MRSVVRIVALLVMLGVLLVVAAAAYADGGCGGCAAPPPAPCASNPCVGISLTGPCPDDLEASKECLQETPPYYVVINRKVECTNRTGTGCAPFILKHDCTDCATCDVDVEKELCKDELLGKVPKDQTAVLYEMCCGGTAGGWKFRIRILDNAGNCPIDPNNRDWVAGLPPGTGINLPAPVIVGGLTFLGVAFLGVGIVVRRRTR